MSREPHPHYEVVIGLEVHAHLETESKLFSPAPVRYGDPPNHDVREVCLGLPGVLPVLNERAVELAIRAGLATHCTVHPRSVFARKNYFYPDLPKGYQISQYEEPICTGGWIEIELEEGDGVRTRRIGITRIHMEEDAGKSIHDAILAGDGSLVDLNRAGVPLLEIVSEPDIRSPEEAAAYLRSLRAILRYADVSEADMERGQFRCDANISLRPRGAEPLGTRTELKNLNSFRFVEEALAAEIERQAGILDGGGRVEQATLLYDPRSRRTQVMRVKEDPDDYRYFPDPDLVPLVFGEDRIEAARATLPELPEARRRRLVGQYGLKPDAARQLAASRALADFFEAAAAVHGEARPVANWVLRDVLQLVKQRELEIERLPITPGNLAALVHLVESGRVTARNARALLPELVETGADPEALVRERGLESLSDTGVLEAAVGEVLAAHADEVERYRRGEVKMLHFLMGRVMQGLRGKADPGAAREILLRELGG